MKKLLFILLMFVTSIGVAQISPDLVWRADTTSANNYRVYITNFPGAYTSDVRFIKFKVTNTDTVTLRVGALPVAPMRKWNGSAWVALDSGDIKINTDYWFAYDSDSSWFRLHNEDLYGSGGLPSGASEDDILSYAGGAPVWSVPDWWNIEGDTQLIDTVKVTTDKMLEFTSIETTGQGTALILDSLGLKLINEWQGGASSGVIQSQSDGRLFVSDEGLDPWLEGGDFETDGDIRILLGTHGFKFQYDATPFAVPFFNISQDTLNGSINGPIELHGDTYNFTSGFGASFLQSYYNEVNFDIVYTFGATDVSVYPDGYKVFTGLQTSGAYTKLKNDSIKFDAPNIQLLEPLTNIDSTVHLLARRDSDGMLVSVDQSSIGGGGGIGGSTGSVDNAILRADGTGGSTLQASAFLINDAGDITQGIAATTSGSTRTYTLAGTSANIGLNIVPKGSGDLQVFSDIFSQGGVVAVNDLSSIGRMAQMSSGSSGNVNFKGFKLGLDITDTQFEGADGTATFVDGSQVSITGGLGYQDSGDGDGGNVQITGGEKRAAGSGTPGYVQLTSGSANYTNLILGDGSAHLTAGATGINGQIQLGNNAGGVVIATNSTGDIILEATGTGDISLQALSGDVYTEHSSGEIFPIDGTVKPVTESGTTLTLDESHRGAFVYFTNAGAVTVTLPTGLKVGYTVTLVQLGTGTVSVTTSGTTVVGATSTSAQYKPLPIHQYSTNNFIGY